MSCILARVFSRARNLFRVGHSSIPSMFLVRVSRTSFLHGELGSSVMGFTGLRGKYSYFYMFLIFLNLCYKFQKTQCFSVQTNIGSMPVHADAPCCAVKSCPLVNDCDLLAGFFNFYPSVSHLTPSMSYRIHIWYGKTRTAMLQSGEGRSRLGTIHQRDRHTHRLTDRQPLSGTK